VSRFATLAIMPDKKLDAVRGRRSRPLLVLAASLLSLVGLGWLDYVTGYELGFFVFYSVPVGLAAWYSGRRAAIAVAFAATITWLLADYYSGAKYSQRFFYYWNGTVHFLAFVINAVTIAKIKSDLDQRHQLAAELAAVKEQLKAVSVLVSTCPSCGKARDNAQPGAGRLKANDHPVEPMIQELLCADCRSQAGEPVDT
jgi:hypothetical protein